MAAEAAAHTLLAEHHLHGEWFRADDDNVLQAIKTAITGAPIETKPLRKWTPPPGRFTGTMRARVDADEHAAFIEAAEMCGLSLSAWTRMRLRQAAIEELQRVGRTVRFLRKKK